MSFKFFIAFLGWLIVFVQSVSGQSCASKPVDVAVLGSGPAGLTSAIYSSRSGLNTILIDGDEPGGQIALSYLVDNFPGFPEGISGFELSENMKKQASRFGTKLISGRVTKIDLQSRPLKIQLENGQEIIAKTMIIATGARARWLGLPSEQALIGKGVTSCAVCDGAMYQNKEVVVVGGGDAAVEDAIFLTNYAKKVTIVHRRDQLRASKHLQDQAFANAKIHFIWNSEVMEVLDPQADEVKAVKIRNRQTGNLDNIPCSGLFIAIGHIPNTGLFTGQLEMNHGGYLTADRTSTKTNIPGVFAAGDVADPVFRQAITASGSGCMAALEAYKYIQEQNIGE
jgi:thioredoxin reductase (NADPH)